MNSIAYTIYQQLGGRQFAFMVGVKNLVDGGNSLKILLKNRSINVVTITLNVWDLYDVEYKRISTRCGNWIEKTVASSEGLYCDMLRADFEEKTGLATTMPRVIGINC